MSAMTCTFFAGLCTSEIERNCDTAKSRSLGEMIVFEAPNSSGIASTSCCTSTYSCSS